MSRTSSLPAGPASRLLKLGRLAGGVVAGMAAESARRLVTGDRPTTGELLVNPRNATQIAERLSELRGAAMKLGQLLSMESGDLWPKEFSQALSQLREDAHRMPLGEVAKQLESSWGKDWPHRFRRFNFQPIAAASIGQVHEATSADEQRLAIKIQYPGVRKSIDSDVDNTAKLLSLLRLVPNPEDLSPLLEEAKRQLHEEADYLAEAQRLMNYEDYLGDHPRFFVPKVVQEWTTADVLVMSFVPGGPLEILEQVERPLRTQIATDLVELSLREVFEWGLVQTDPNFSNYRYDDVSGRVGLLDFGAARAYDASRVRVLRRLLSAGIEANAAALEGAAIDAGYLPAQAPEIYRDTIVSLLLDVTEPARHTGDYDFATTNLARRMREKVTELRFEERVWHTPPADLLFLHRKLGGLYMLCSRLRVGINVRNLVTPYLL